VDGNNVYNKVISVLFAGLLGATGVIWNNSQKQISASLERIEDLTKTINVMQSQMGLMNYRIDATNDRLEDINMQLRGLENNSQYPARPRFSK